MKASIRLGRIGGIPLGAHWSVLVILLLIADLLATSILPATVKGVSTLGYWTVGTLVALALLLSLVAHEAAHALVARRAGVTVRSITLWMLGGVTDLETAPADARSDLRVAVVGPAVSLVCAAVSGGAALALWSLGAPQVVTAGLWWLAATNVVLAVFNLLPAAPLDGGRVLRAIVWRRTSDRDRAERAATRSGRATGIVLIGLGLLEAMATADLVGGLWLTLIGWFVMSSANAELQASVTERALGDLTVGDVMQASDIWLPDYQHVDVAARRAVETGDDFLPVCDIEGSPVGIVSTDRLVQAARQGLPDTRVRNIAVALTPRMAAAVDEGLVAALRRAGPANVIAAFDDGHLVGLVTPAMVTRALRRGLLPTGTTPDRCVVAGGDTSNRGEQR